MRTPKKPKARRMWMLPGSEDAFVDRDFLVDSDKAIPVAVLDVSDPDALIEVVERSLFAEFFGRDHEDNYETFSALYKSHARAALTAIGVLRGK